MLQNKQNILFNVLNKFVLFSQISKLLQSFESTIENVIQLIIIQMSAENNFKK